MKRKEKKAAAQDNRRTESLLDAMDVLVKKEGERSPFVKALVDGLMSDTCTCHPYPPEGHGYPR